MQILKFEGECYMCFSLSFISSIPLEYFVCKLVVVFFHFCLPENEPSCESLWSYEMMGGLPSNHKSVCSTVVNTLILPPFLSYSVTVRLFSMLFIYLDIIMHKRILVTFVFIYWRLLTCFWTWDKIWHWHLFTDYLNEIFKTCTYILSSHWSLPMHTHCGDHHQASGTFLHLK